MTTKNYRIDTHWAGGYEIIEVFDPPHQFMDGHETTAQATGITATQKWQIDDALKNLVARNKKRKEAA
tara:strand:+ start:3665 stop:3868 length:204 start_codon:yes stop_codon:yes gene_type:complete